MPKNEFYCLPTAIGSMPHTDPKAACSQVTRYLKDVPVWPQLPRRSFLEDMNVQYSEGFPGVVVDMEQKKIRVDRTKDLSAQLEKLYNSFLADEADAYPISRDYAAGFYEFLSLSGLNPRVVKGQVTGPVTFGLNIVDEAGKGIVYDDFLGDAVPKFLKLKAAWEEKQLKQICRDTIIFFDEPYMSAFGSVGMMLSREKVIALLDEVLSGVSGLKGVHCCGNTDWTVILATKVDILNFDAYGYAQSLALYPNEVKKFIERGGVVAWGIVPTSSEPLGKESVASLQDRLEEAIAPFTRNNGTPFKTLLAQSLLTPSCGLGSLPGPDESGRALELLAGLSDKIRRKYA